MAGGTSWRLGALSLFLFVASLSALPTPETTTSSIDDVEEITLATELKPPPPPEKEDHQYVLFVINIYGLRNSSDETSEEMLENELIEKVPQLKEPLATVLLVVEVDDSDEDVDAPVDLDKVAEELGNDTGFNVEKISHAGETKLLKVNLDKSDAENIWHTHGKSGVMNKLRKRRSYCVKCSGGGGTYPSGGGGCGGGGCGGGGYPGGGGGYPYGGGGYPGGGGGYPGGGGGYPGGGGGYPGGGYPTGGGGYPSGGCSTCGGGGKATASAQANAQANAGGWGK